MPRVALAIAYDGTAFDSYARQPGHRTVEGEILRVLREGRVFAGHARFASASRTDAGVSAAWNVVAFDSARPPRALASLTSLAPEGLHFLSATSVPEDWRPRNASARAYRYALDGSWDWTRIRPLARRFQGLHDFSNFRRADGDKPPIATLTRLRRIREGGRHWLEFEAPSFLWQQVRRIVGALDGVERGRFSPREVQEALDHPERRVDLGVAPPEPLVLWRVDYDGVVFPASPRVARDRIGRAARRAETRSAWLTLTRGKAGPIRR